MAKAKKKVVAKKPVNKFGRKMVINVTANDIKEGDRLDDCHCPIARAFCRVLGIRNNNKGLVRVGSRFITYKNRNYYQSAVIRNFIDKFDHAQKVSPMRFVYTPVFASHVGV
jgi:hypothetical protein